MITPEWFTENLAELVLALLAFIKVIVNITPTTADNQVFGYVDVLINMMIKDRRKQTPNEE